MSSSNLSAGVVDFFSDSEHEIHYGLLKLLPQSFQDDLMRLCKNPLDAQFGNDRFETLAETKLLSYNMTKTCIVLLGPQKAKQSLEGQFLKTPPLVYGKPVKISSSESYLGDQIGSSVSDSISLTSSAQHRLASHQDSLN